MCFNMMFEIQVNHLMSNEAVLSISNNFELYFAEIFLIDLKCFFWNSKQDQSVQEEQPKYAIIRTALILLWDQD